MQQEFLDATDLKLLDALQHDATLSNVALSERLKISPPTCLRRVKRLTDEGWIERQIAVLNSDKLGATLGHGLTALIEVTLDTQGAEHLDAFEKRACADDAVQQCWRRRAAMLARVARAGLCIGGPSSRHARLSGDHATHTHARRECAECESVLCHQAGEVHQHLAGVAPALSPKNV